MPLSREEIGSHLRRAREHKGLTLKQMGAKLFVPHQTVSTWEKSKRMPKQRNRWLRIISEYGLWRFESERIFEAVFPDSPLSPEEWSKWGKPFPIISLDPRVGDFFSNLLKAGTKEIIEDKDENRWVYAEQKDPVSALFTQFTAKYRIESAGFLYQQTEIEMLQLSPQQVILTPLYVGIVRQKRTIKWNGIEISNTLEEVPSQVNFVAQTGVNSVYFYGKLKDLDIGVYNKLFIGMESHLLLCALRERAFAFCVPVFYALDPTSFSFELPEGLEDIEIFLAERDRENPVKWTSTELAINQEKNEICVSISSNIEKIREKRYCPDLLIVKFRKVLDNLFPQAIMLSRNRKRPARIALAFFCGKDEGQCPANEPGQL